MLEGNKITIRTNRFTNHPSIMIREYTCIQMKKYLKSIKSANEKFTNYASSAAAKKYKKVKSLYEANKVNSDTIGDNFIADEINYQKNKIDRLIRIIYENTNILISKKDIINKKIRKYKNNEDKEIQFYFYSADEKVLNLLLVDLYHLGIPALKNGKDVWNLNYSNHENDKYCLSNITK